MQLQLRTAIQSSGNKSEKREKREQLKAKKCEKKEKGGRKRGRGERGLLESALLTYIRADWSEREVGKTPHKTKQEIHLYTRTRKGNSRC